MHIKEMAASLYPWDLADEGVDTCIHNLTELAGVNSVYLVGIMHKEKRPIRESYYPHNPKRKFYIPEDSRVYYRMDENNFKNTPLKPTYSSVDFLKDVDWLDELIKGARKHNLKVGTEISHTVFDGATALKQYPEILQRNIHGKFISGKSATQNSALCPNHEYVREYLKALFYDTVKNHDIDYIQSCLVMFNEGQLIGNTAPYSEHDNELSLLLGVVRGGCFCESCKSKAVEMGYDWDKITTDLKRLYDVATQSELADMMEKKLLDQGNLLAFGFLMENPSLFQWLDFRQKSITSLFKDLHAAVKSANPKVEFRYNTYLKYPELGGLNLADVKDYVDSIRESDYAEQFGDINKLGVKKKRLLKHRRAIGYEKDLIAAIDVRPSRDGGTNEDVLRESVRLLSNYGIDGISLGHYDEATFSRLRAVKEGMIEGEMEIIPRKEW